MAGAFMQLCQFCICEGFHLVAISTTAAASGLPTSGPNWFARGIGSSTITPALLLGLVGFALWFVDQRSALQGVDGHGLVIALSLAAVAAGCLALSWVRPQRAGLSPPHVMLSLGFGGMLMGFAYDLVHAGVDRLSSLCVQSSVLTTWQSFLLHVDYLPGMHTGMLVGGLLAIPSLRLLRSHCGRYLCSLFLQNLMCSGWMLLGMTLGAVWLVRLQLAFGNPSVTAMLGGMFVGMTWGMVVSVALYRSYFTLRGPKRKDS
jgi:hypothetical protein